jgi:hypothetical protein
MGRRSFPEVRMRSMPDAEAKRARDAVIDRMRYLSRDLGINLAQFRAQIHEEEMVELLVGFSRDLTLPASLRRQCAIDVVTFARGRIEPWQHEGQTIDPQATGGSGHAIGEEIQAARLTAEGYERLNDLIMRRVPSDQWPEDIRELAGQALLEYEGG